MFRDVLLILVGTRLLIENDRYTKSLCWMQALAFLYLFHFPVQCIAPEEFHLVEVAESHLPLNLGGATPPTMLMLCGAGCGAKEPELE